MPLLSPCLDAGNKSSPWKRTRKPWLAPSTMQKCMVFREKYSGFTATSSTCFRHDSRLSLRKPSSSAARHGEVRHSLHGQQSQPTEEAFPANDQQARSTLTTKFSIWTRCSRTLSRLSTNRSPPLQPTSCSSCLARRILSTSRSTKVRMRSYESRTTACTVPARHSVFSSAIMQWNELALGWASFDVKSERSA